MEAHGYDGLHSLIQKTPNFRHLSQQNFVNIKYMKYRVTSNFNATERYNTLDLVFDTYADALDFVLGDMKRMIREFESQQTYYEADFSNMIIVVPNVFIYQWDITTID